MLMSRRGKAPASGLRHHQFGFTLIELMVGLAIFSLLGSACYQFLRSMTQSQASLQAAAEQRGDLVKAFIVIDQDMRHLIPRSVRRMGSEGRLPALDGRNESGFEFSRTGFPMRNSVHLVGARRVNYFIQSEKEIPTLYREVYAALDRVEATPVYRQELLQGASKLKLRFMDDEGQWTSRWPAEGKSEDDTADQIAELPRGIEISIDMSSGQTLQRFISLR